jgi:hypothetical protein
MRRRMWGPGRECRCWRVAAGCSCHRHRLQASRTFTQLYAYVDTVLNSSALNSTYSLAFPRQRHIRYGHLCTTLPLNTGRPNSKVYIRMFLLCTHARFIPRWKYRFSSDQRSQATLGPVSTDVGDQSGTQGDLAFLHPFFSKQTFGPR